MNYVIIRTKLQAQIARRLVELGYLESPFSVVRLYLHSKYEDDKGSYRAYELLERNACRVDSIRQADGIFANVVSILKIFTYSRLSGGRVYLGSLNLYSLAIALRIYPWQSIITFDDGTANFELRDNSYKSRKAIAGNTLKNRLVRFAFPFGASAHVITKIARHYTIYRNRENVVSGYKLSFIEMDWIGMLDSNDIRKLPKSIKTILIGTVYKEVLNNSITIDNILRFRSGVDLYIPHPREKDTIQFDLSATAESIIEYYACQNNITVFHFGSTVAAAFDNDKRVLFVNLLA